MIRKAFLSKIYDAANMQRWNDKIRPVELRELDKQAHKMIIAYVLGKCEEEDGNGDFDWIEIIEGGLFEFLKRLVVTDLKPQLFHRIQEDRDSYRKLNDWVYDQIEPVLSPIGKSFCGRFKGYLSDTDENVNKRVLSAAHFYATKWEFDIIERANPRGYEMEEIKGSLQARQEKYYDLKGLQRLTLYSNLRSFVDLCGDLRFQIRWSTLHMIPRTSVLGHMLIVAVLSYLVSLQVNACRKRCINNYLTGLFHDLPEVLTRDIINPVKKSVEGIDHIIKKYEKEEMEKKIYKLIPNEWHPEIRMFTEDEFKNIVIVNGRKVKKKSEEISKIFNKDKYNPRDGEIVKAVDNLAAFMEAYLALENGVKSTDLEKAKIKLGKMYRGKTVCGINFGEIYSELD